MLRQFYDNSLADDKTPTRPPSIHIASYDVSHPTCEADEVAAANSTDYDAAYQEAVGRDCSLERIHFAGGWESASNTNPRPSTRAELRAGSGAGLGYAADAIRQTPFVHDRPSSCSSRRYLHYSLHSSIFSTRTVALFQTRPFSCIFSK